MRRYHGVILLGLNPAGILLAGTSSMIARKIRLGIGMTDRPIAQGSCASLLSAPESCRHRQLAADVASRHREISRQFLLISTPLMGVPELR